MTPAIAAGVSDHVWEIEETVGLLERWEAVPNIDDQKPCVDENCEGTMTWKNVHPPDPAFVGEGGTPPDPLPDYEAWVCDTCPLEERSN